VKKGLSERILAASGFEDVSRLLEEGRGYDAASDKTRRRWRVVAARRRQEILKAESAAAAGTVCPSTP
jgi:hypothetical protein